MFCTLTREQASLYTAVVNEVEQALDESQGIERKGLILATLSKLKQVCNHPAQFLGDRSSLPGRSGKLEASGGDVEEILAVGERALIFTQFARDGRAAAAASAGHLRAQVLFLHGGVPKKERDRMVERVPAGTGAAPLRAVPQGRRHRPESDRGESRLPF